MLVVVSVVLSTTPVAQIKVMLHAPGLRWTWSRRGWRPQSIEGCGRSGAALVRELDCVVCGVVSRTRFRKGKKKRVLSLSLWGCCAQCKLSKQNLGGV